MDTLSVVKILLIYLYNYNYINILEFDIHFPTLPRCVRIFLTVIIVSGSFRDDSGVSR